MTEASESPYNGLRGRGDSDGHAGAASGAMSRLCALGARHGVACGAVAHSADGLPKSTKRLITACYCGTQFVIGMIIGGVGAELPGLGRQTGTGLAEENMLMLARSVAYLCGSMIAGKLLEKLSGNRLNAAALLTLSLFTFMTPIPTNVYFTVALFAVAGLAGGFLDCSTNTLLVWLWGHEVDVWMQVMHLSFSIGAMVAPIITSAVLGSEEEGGDVGPSFFIQAAIALPFALMSVCIPAPPPRAGGGGHGHGGGGEEEAGDGQALKDAPREALKDAPRERAAKHNDDDADGCCGRCVVNSRIPWLEYWVVFCVSTFLLMGAGTEVGLAGWISNYAVEKYGATEQTGALLTSAFWMGMTAGRFVAVPLALRFSPRAMLTGDILLGLVGLGILYWTPNIAGDWAGTIICGVAIASMFPSAMSLPVSLNMRVSGTATAWFVSGASSGEMVVPFLMGVCMDAFGDEAMIIVPAVCLIFAAVILASLLVTAPNPDEGLLPRHRFDADVDDAFNIPPPMMRGFRYDRPPRAAAEGAAMELATRKVHAVTPEPKGAHGGAAGDGSSSSGGGGGVGGTAEGGGGRRGGEADGLLHDVDWGS